MDFCLINLCHLHINESNIKKKIKYIDIVLVPVPISAREYYDDFFVALY